MNIQRIYRGKPFTFEYRVYFGIWDDNDEKEIHLISPFHDIPLMSNDIPLISNVKDHIFNFICEIPKGTQAKMEISKDTKWNPIKQDTKKGRLRYVQYQSGYSFNYGALPQTWEGPYHIFKETGLGGDNDPMDVCEIGSKVRKTGDIIPVKVLGCLPMVDDNETDWKLICIAIDDPEADKLNNIDDVDEMYLDELREWFRFYKTPTGKPPNKFAMKEEFQNKQFSLKIIQQSHEYWEKLVTKQCDPCGIEIDRYDYQK